MQTVRCPLILLVAWALSCTSAAIAQTTRTAQPAITSTRGVHPNLTGQTERPLRYRPEGSDFVIENGPEFFNRPLYGRNTAARVDAGDKPEFSLYLPGRGGNLRLGVRSSAGTKWLADAARIVTRYRPGMMLYEIHDPLLGADGVVNVGVLALNATDGLAVRVEAQSLANGTELVWAYGGANGQRGSRDGDIGTERVPIGEYFQLKPEFCENNRFTLGDRTFTLRSKPAVIIGLMPAGSKLAVADARQWASFDALLGSVAPAEQARPVVIGRVALPTTGALFLALQRVAESAVPNEELQTYRDVTTAPPGASTAPAAATVNFIPPYHADEIARVFTEAEAYYKMLRERVAVETPDAFINAAVGALNLAADAVWDEPQKNVMHGAIAWRSRLLGWRGPTAMDALGWHQRAREYCLYWAARQNTNPIPEKLPPPDEDANLARSEKALHSNGDMSGTHYDMNLAYIDALNRHLLWTGDLALARQLWPVIERHLAWERRLFRREFGPEKLPLYEAYAAIWASDDIQYHGGGVTHSSAYNYYHNKMAARLAGLIGQDPAPYEREAELIAKAMRTYLWLDDRGTFAEFKDLLGNQLVHPSAGLWTFYHTIDSQVPTARQAWQMAAALDRALPRIPIHGPGVPSDRAYHMLPSSDWMPYSWSINNVVMGENLHTALAYWKAGRADEAFSITKAGLLASMYMGICPGNVGTMNYLDVYRRESQRDFADGCAVMSRAIIEGLFGLRPDALAGELRVEPGFPRTWPSAKLSHPDVHLEFSRDGSTERWVIGKLDARFGTIRLRLPATHERIAAVDVNGTALKWSPLPDAVGQPAIELIFPAGQATVTIKWEGDAIPALAADQSPGRELVRTEKGQFTWWAPVKTEVASVVDASPQPVFDWRAARPAEKCEPLDLAAQFNDRVTAIFAPGKYRSPRSPFVSLALPAQGIGAWAGHVNASATIDDSGLRRAAAANGGRLVMPNGVPFATPAAENAPNIAFTSQWDNYPREAVVPMTGRGSRLYLLMAGSTNFMQCRLDNGEVLVTYTDGTQGRLPLNNPTTWWPIDQDYFIDDYQFRNPGPLPPRVNLKSGEIRLLEEKAFKGRGGVVNGGAATVLQLPLDAGKPLRSLTVRAIANEVVIGLMAATIERP